jgi:proteasome lid subunit RPN8/RPN11
VFSAHWPSRGEEMSSLDVRAIEDAELRKEKAPAVKTEFRVFLAEEAFDRAVERGTSDTSREIGGVLVGELLKDDAGPYLKIDTTVDALHAEEKGAELTFTHATWEHINKEMDTKHKGKKVVGWYHTHPGFGVFLSDRDQFIQKSFFNLPFQVAFVYDPKSKEHGMFTWHDNEVRRARRYWVGNREQNWDGNRTSGEPTKKDVERKEPEAAARPSEPLLGEGPGALATLVILGLIMLLIGGFVGRWWGASGAAQAVQQAQLDLIKAKQEGATLMAAQLQSDLVGVLRATLGDESVRKPVAVAIADLDVSIKELEGKPDSAKAVETLKALRENLLRLSEDRASAHNTLAQLEMLSKRNSAVRADLERDVMMQRTGLGQLYAEIAADVSKTDKARAKRLLATAAVVDPGNTSRYEQMLQQFDKTAKLPRPQIEVVPQQPAPAAGSAATGSGSATGSGGVQ